MSFCRAQNSGLSTICVCLSNFYKIFLRSSIRILNLTNNESYKYVCILDRVQIQKKIVKNLWQWVSRKHARTLRTVIADPICVATASAAVAVALLFPYCRLLGLNALSRAFVSGRCIGFQCRPLRLFETVSKVKKSFDLTSYTDHYL